MNTVYTCDSDGIVKKYYRCHNCHSETKPVGIDCDQEFKTNGQKNSVPEKKKQNQNKKPKSHKNRKVEITRGK